MNFSGLRTLFGTGEQPTVVSDSSYVLRRFDASGFQTLSLDAVRSQSVQVPTAVLLIPAIPTQHPDTALLAALRGSAVVVVPLLAFAYGTRDIDYLLLRLARLSFSAAC